MAKQNGIINWESYGALLRYARIINGYSRGSDLADVVQEKTGLKISERMIYALEVGERSPSADIYIALQQVLPELQDPKMLKDIFRKSNVTLSIVEIRQQRGQ